MKLFIELLFSLFYKNNKTLERVFYQDCVVGSGGWGTDKITVACTLSWRIAL